MKRYQDYQKNKSNNSLTEEELSQIKWTKYKIIVPTEDDKKELIDAFEHIHYSDIDTDYITVNQLAHEYLETGYPNNIIVDEKLFKKLETNS